MQRVLSLETASRSANQTSEFVTKRLCCSIILTVAFLTMLGGFFLGRFVAERGGDKMRLEILELSRKTSALNSNLRTTFGSGINFNNCSQYIFLKCNFTEIGNNATGLLTPLRFITSLNDCFGNG